MSAKTLRGLRLRARTRLAIADEEAQLARLAEEVLPKITAPTAACKAGPEPGSRAN